MAEKNDELMVAWNKYRDASHSAVEAAWHYGKLAIAEKDKRPGEWGAYLKAQGIHVKMDERARRIASQLTLKQVQGQSWVGLLTMAPGRPKKSQEEPQDEVDKAIASEKDHTEEARDPHAVELEAAIDREVATWRTWSPRKWSSVEKKCAQPHVMDTVKKLVADVGMPAVLLAVMRLSEKSS